jgi:hypothetical protein
MWVRVPERDDMRAPALRTRALWAAPAGVAVVAGVALLAADRAVSLGWVLIVCGAALVSVLIAAGSEG